jgi:hypothetical protein
MILDSLIDAATFVPESLQPPNAWIGHLPLAAWVIRRVAPTIFVELGTHSGNSYFSFCQSVVESGLATRCYAVDTWQGDEQAGRYDEKVFAAVNAHNEKRYACFSRLLRMTFDDALGLFSDQSIELLHIDGLHTFEAVRHDFEGWLPKLAPGAVVMFHDIGVREQSFGVWRLWDGLKAEYPNHIELPHSHGLGILQLNNALDGRRQEWLQLDVFGKERLTTYFAALGSRQLERFELNSELSTSKQDVSVRDVLIADLRQHESNLGKDVAARDAVIADLGQRVTSLKGVIADLTQHASNLEQVVAARDAVIADLRQHASNLQEVVSARDTVIADLGQHVSNLGVVIDDLKRHASNLEQEVASRDAVIADLRQHASNLEQVVSARDAVIADLGQHAANLGLEVSARDARVAGLDRLVVERDVLIADLTREVNALRQSTSWRITVPLRWVADSVKKARQSA